MGPEDKYMGLLGLGSKTTTFYIEQLNQAYNKLYGGYSTCPFILININFHLINTLLPKTSEQLYKLMSKHLLNLSSYNLSSIIIPNITLHETIDCIQEKENMPFKIVHPISHTVNLIKKHKHDNVVIIGSKYSITSNYIKSYFKHKGIDCITPIHQDIKKFEEMRKIVYQKGTTPELIDKFNQRIKFYTQSTAVVISCTELSILNNSTNNTYDMARIQISRGLENHDFNKN